MPRILYRYLILEILPPFGVSLLGLTSIVFLGRMMKITQMIVVKGVGLIDVLKTCAFLLPYLLVFTLPMAATVGILLAMTRLTVDQEMIAMKTAGLSYGQLLPPVLGFSLAVGLLTLGITMFASPWGQQATKDLMKDVVKRRADMGIQEQTFNTDFNGMTLFVNHVAPKGGHLEGVFVYDSRDAENPLTVYAENGDLSYDRDQETMLMKLYDGRIIRWGKAPNRWQTLEFKTYKLPLEVFSFALKGAKSESEMSLGELRESHCQATAGIGPLQPGPGGTEPAVCHAGGGGAPLSDGHAPGVEPPAARAHLGPDPGPGGIFGVLYNIYCFLAPGRQRPDRSGAGALAVQFPVYLGGPVSVVPDRAGTAVAAGGLASPAMGRCQGEGIEEWGGPGGKG